ncbi:hypothetical protein EV182_004589 [Spiromyces aspiralis]|uniref:Uncharacterized protein n=1 Tax=Spiromyces aspiralis TaxID=68401 RepID=A0ACC1HNQ4_9FUNG|nr:hypothetical protein EV182_004589 [Spiromyces aspiralis]
MGAPSSSTLHPPSRLPMHPNQPEALFSPTTLFVRLPTTVCRRAGPGPPRAAGPSDDSNGPVRSPKYHASAPFTALQPPLSGFPDVPAPASNSKGDHLITPTLPILEQHPQARPLPHVYC